MLVVIEAPLLQDTFQMSCTRWPGMGHSPASTVRESSFQKAWIRQVFLPTLLECGDRGSCTQPLPVYLSIYCIITMCTHYFLSQIVHLEQ